MSIEPELACVGLRPMPVDGIPLIGYLPNISGVYVCVMHPKAFAPDIEVTRSASDTSGNERTVSSEFSTEGSAE
jgi:hypothetical protein